MNGSLVAIAKPLKPSIENFNDAVLQLQAQEKDVQGLFATLRDTQHGLIMTRFREGAIIHALIEKEGNATATIDRLSRAVGISRALLWNCRRFYLRDEWGQSDGILEQWLSERSHNMSWARIKNKMMKQYSPEQPEYFAKETERLEKLAQKLDSEMEQFDQELEEYAIGDYFMEGKGVVAKAKEITADLIERVHEIKDKTAPKRDKKYLDFIRKCPCCVSGAHDNVVPHHVFSRGRGVKCTDYGTIPLASELHDRLHRMGVRSFCNEYNLDLWEEVAHHLAMYFTGKRIF